MRTNKLLAATALAGSLAIATCVWGSAQAMPGPTGSHAIGNSSVTLVAEQGGGGGASPGGGGHMGSSGAGGGPATASSGPRGGGPGMSGGPRAGSHAMNDGGGREYGREGPRGRTGYGDRGRFAEGDRDHRHFEGDRDHGRFAERGHDHDHDFDHRGAHRVFRNGVWVWVYGPDYYGYNDCGWLRIRALDTGSPYWWNRYQNCVGYY
jgi:hypothetical protein